MTRRTKLQLASMAGLLMLSAGLFLTISPTVGATPPDRDGEHKVTLCHRTNSVTNPYVIITVDYAAADGALGQGNGDHTIHMGQVFDFEADPDVAYPTPRNGDQWGDIIPPYGDEDQFGGMNWNADGQAVFAAGCGRPVTTTTEETTPPTTPTTQGTTTTTEEVTTTTEEVTTTTEEVTTTTEETTTSVAPATVPPTVEPDVVTSTPAVPDTEAEVLPDVVTRPEALPRTGQSTGWMTVFGIGLLVSGAVLVGESRRAVARLG